MLTTISKPIYFKGAPILAYFPSIDSTTNDFSFSINSSLGVFGVEAHWVNNLWKLYFTFPSGKVKEATLWPQVITWIAGSEYMLMFHTPSYTSVVHDDISSSIIKVYQK